MPTIETGKVKNINADIQDHLDKGGKIELVIQRDGKIVLQTATEQTEEGK